MLAQAVMTEAELERFPDLGITSGDFESAFPGEFRDFRWARNVEASGMFPDVRKVEIMIRYGPNLSQNFGIVEFLHSPVPPDTTTLPAGSTPVGSTPVGQTPVGQTP